MSDFHQNGMFTNFHNLTRRPVEDLEQELLTFSKRRKMGLILPSLFSELEGPALNHIINELTKVPYLEEIVIERIGSNFYMQKSFLDDYRNAIVFYGMMDLV